MKKVSTQKKFQKKKLEISKEMSSQHTFKKISIEKSKKILSDSGTDLTDDEIKHITEWAHHLADLIIKEFILK